MREVLDHECKIGSAAECSVHDGSYSLGVMKPSHTHTCRPSRSPRRSRGIPVRVRGDAIHAKVSIFFLINFMFLRFLLNTDPFPITTHSLHRFIHCSIYSTTSPHVLPPFNTSHMTDIMFRTRTCCPNPSCTFRRLQIPKTYKYAPVSS